MWCLNNGAISLNRPIEGEYLEKRVQDIFNNHIDVYIDNFEIVFDEMPGMAIEGKLNDLVKLVEENGYTIADDPVIGFYGDCDGAYVFERGEFVCYDLDSAVFWNMSDEDLIRVMESRGYYVTGTRS